MKSKSKITWLAALFAVFSAAVLIYGRYIEPDRIEVRQIDVHPEFNPALKGRTIVHISDLHIEEFGKKETDLLTQINRLQPDLIFLTGDYIKWNRHNEGALHFFSRIKARYGVFAVMGDYDSSVSRTSCLFCHNPNSGSLTNRHDVIMLRNAMYELKIEDSKILIAGIGQEDEGSDSLEEAFKTIENDIPLFVLSHSPMNYERFSKEEKRFLFSGDTHGGQVRFPKWVYRLFGYEKNVKYNYGLFRDGEKMMYVTSGIGTSHFNFRLFCGPEIVVFSF